MAKLDATHEKTRAEIAQYLREFAEKLDTGVSGAAGSTGETGAIGEPDRSPDVAGSDERTDAGADRKITVVAGNDSATINPPETLAFDVSVDTDSGLLEGDEQSATFTLRWDRDHVEADDELSVQ
ncbi:amphi-Trp domain-containing protein [Natronorarus salvus]|uniref:amphi-Trp domain-containing protein n=1 Tax=Natronorarus salvus TaxID=3117733 RepID=UPI002F2676AF